MKHTYTKLAVAMLVAFSGASYASGVNFSNLSSGTVTNLTISQTGTGKSRISGGNALTSTHTVTTDGTSAKNTSFVEADEADTAFVHEGSLTTLSLTQATSSANGVDDNNENTITGAMYTTGGSVTVAQTGDANAVDLAIGASGAALTTPTISITQTGNDNQTELTRTAGVNTDTIAITGNSNAVKVTGASTGTNSVHLTLDTGSDSNQVWAEQSGSNNAMKVNVSGDSNVLDLTQSGSNGSLTGAVSGTGATITGSSNHFYLSQSGSANTATIDITGSTNKVDVAQSGATTSAILALNGSGNDIGITQSGSGVYANLSIASTSATVSVTQSTAGASYTYAGTVPSSGSITVTQ